MRDVRLKPMNNPPIRLTNDQFRCLNHVLAIAKVSVEANGWHHHDAAINQAQRVMAVCELDPISFTLASILDPGWDKEEAA